MRKVLLINQLKQLQVIIHDLLKSIGIKSYSIHLPENVDVLEVNKKVSAPNQCCAVNDIVWTLFDDRLTLELKHYSPLHNYRNFNSNDMHRQLLLLRTSNILHHNNRSCVRNYSSRSITDIYFQDNKLLRCCKRQLQYISVQSYQQKSKNRCILMDGVIQEKGNRDFYKSLFVEVIKDMHGLNETCSYSTMTASRGNDCNAFSCHFNSFRNSHKLTGSSIEFTQLHTAAIENTKLAASNKFIEEKNVSPDPVNKNAAENTCNSNNGETYTNSTETAREATNACAASSVESMNTSNYIQEIGGTETCNTVQSIAMRVKKANNLLNNKVSEPLLVEPNIPLDSNKLHIFGTTDHLRKPQNNDIKSNNKEIIVKKPKFKVGSISKKNQHQISASHLTLFKKNLRKDATIHQKDRVNDILGGATTNEGSKRKSYFSIFKHPIVQIKKFVRDLLIFLQFMVEEMQLKISNINQIKTLRLNRQAPERMQNKREANDSKTKRDYDLYSLGIEEFDILNNSESDKASVKTSGHLKSNAAQQLCKESTKNNSKFYSQFRNQFKGLKDSPPFNDLKLYDVTTKSTEPFKRDLTTNQPEMLIRFTKILMEMIKRTDELFSKNRKTIGVQNDKVVSIQKTMASALKSSSQVDKKCQSPNDLLVSNENFHLIRDLDMKSINCKLYSVNEKEKEDNDWRKPCLDIKIKPLDNKHNFSNIQVEKCQFHIAKNETLTSDLDKYKICTKHSDDHIILKDTIHPIIQDALTKYDKFLFLDLKIKLPFTTNLSNSLNNK